MLRIKLKPLTNRRALRTYYPSSLVSAFNLVKTTNTSVYAAAKKHGVPITTLRDRVDSRISIDTTKSGPEPILSLEEENRLCAHIKEMAEVGYGYTRSEVISLASDYAVTLGKRSRDKPFSLQWYYDFMGRWPELKLVKPSSLSEQRAKCASEECVKNYFEELHHILTKYDLHNKPQNIYNIDEKGMNTKFKPPSVVAGVNCKAQAIMAERSKTVTIIGAGNAIGTQIPPYFVFPGERFLDSLMDGKTPGADGTMTKSGWSNTGVFRKYIKEHFMKYVQGRSDSKETILVLYDGHRSHVAIDLIDWALENNIVLFVLPPHTSHILQPMDVGCFGPLQNSYNHECTTFARLNHRVVTRYDVCTLACKAYSVALAPSNLQAAFKRAGIYPLLDGSTMCERLGLKLKPSTLYENCNKADESDDASDDKQTNCVVNDETVSTDFFTEKNIKTSKKVTKKRRNVSDVIGGKALEGKTVEKLREYVDPGSGKLQKVAKCAQKKVKKQNSVVKQVNKQIPVDQKKVKKQIPVPVSPQPGPSCINLIEDFSASSDTESEADSGGVVCCVCQSFFVPREKLDGTLFITQWVGCDKCDHWVHLKFCTELRVARTGTPFVCKGCLP